MAALRPSNATVERVAHCLAAIESASIAAEPRQHCVALCVIDRLAEPRAVVGVIAAGQRFLLEADEVDLAARVLTDEQPIVGARLVAGLLLVACALAVVLYPPTRAFARFKARRRDLAWLRYL